MIASSNKDMKSIWEYVRQIRADYIWNLDFPNRNYFCSSFINSHQDIDENFEKLAELLNSSNVTEEVLDISLEKIEEGAKMLLYLNSCPSILSLNLKTIFSSLDANTIIVSTMQLLKSSKDKTLDSIIEIFNDISYEYGNNYNKISYEPLTKSLEFYKNLSILNGNSENFVKKKKCDSSI